MHKTPFSTTFLTGLAGGAILLWVVVGTGLILGWWHGDDARAALMVIASLTVTTTVATVVLAALRMFLQRVVYLGSVYDEAYQAGFGNGRRTAGRHPRVVDVRDVHEAREARGA